MNWNSRWRVMVFSDRSLNHGPVGQIRYLFLIEEMNFHAAMQSLRDEGYESDEAAKTIWNWTAKTSMD